MIAVTGEALIDLIIDSDGCIAPRLGGAPFNTARAIGRLGLAPVFLGRLSADRFGRQLQASLEADGVTLAVPGLTDAPTTLAVVDLDQAKAYAYAVEVMAVTSQLPDAREGMRSFLEKRKPQWRQRS